MNIDDVKQRVADECESLQGCLPNEADQVEGDDWQSLADDAREIARHLAISATRIAGYAGYAQRRANQG